MRCDLVPADSPRWVAFLERAEHDFYHLPGYARLSARLDGGEARALVVSDGSRELLLPLIIRPLPGDQRDATSPYGYPGPIVAGDADPGFQAEALQAGAHALAAEGLVSVFIRLHPLLNREVGGLEVIVTHADGVTIDLSLSEEDARRQMRSNHRLQIDRARRAGARVVIDTDSEHDAIFRRLYRRSMSRLDADSFYRFDDRYFDELRQVLGDRLQVAVVEIEGDPAAAGLFVEMPGITEYHLSGSDERFVHMAPTKLMIDEIRRWARARGGRWFFLGGGLGFSDDSLFRFKAGFSTLRSPLRTLRMILLPDAYERLVRARSGEPGTADATGFFPAYRRPAEPANHGSADATVAGGS
jgi:hypothetical protein